MTCEHLIELERAIIAAGIRETSRGQAWSRNCREWVYGAECGFVCSVHRDGIMGHHPASGAASRTFDPT